MTASAACPLSADHDDYLAGRDRPRRARSEHHQFRPSPRLGVDPGGAKRPPRLGRGPLLRELRGHPLDRVHGATWSQPLARHGPQARAAPGPPPGRAHWRRHPRHGGQRCLRARRADPAGPRALPRSGAALCSVVTRGAMSANPGLRSAGARSLDPLARAGDRARPDTAMSGRSRRMSAQRTFLQLAEISPNAPAH